jgi:hypothetical protein
MDRRAFMTGTAGGALAAAPLLAGGPEPRDARITTYVTDIRYHHGLPISLPRGAPLALARVRERAYDSLSLAVLAPTDRPGVELRLRETVS